MSGANANLRRARVIFRYAEAFSDAADKLVPPPGKAPRRAKIHTNDAAYIAPLTTMDSFALELYLKSLLVTDHGKAVKGHDLVKLFSALNDGTQRAIRHVYNLRITTDRAARDLAKTHPRMELGLDMVLGRSAKAFESVRYLYEGTEGKQLFYSPLLRQVVRKVILDSYPEWGAKR